MWLYKLIEDIIPESLNIIQQRNSKLAPLGFFLLLTYSKSARILGDAASLFWLEKARYDTNTTTMVKYFMN